MADLTSLQSLGSVETLVEAPVHVQKIDSLGRAYATGKRKDAVARVWVKPGSGKIIVNGKEFAAYFARPVLQMMLRQPIVAAARDGQFDIIATVAGGGLSGQAGAVRHGISKAITYYEPGAARRPQEGRLPDPRQPRRRAQEVRQGQGTSFVPVLQALSFRDSVCGRPAATPASFFVRASASQISYTSCPFEQNMNT